MLRRLSFVVAALACVLVVAPAATSARPHQIPVAGMWIPFDLGAETCTPLGAQVSICRVTGFQTQYTGDLTGTARAEFVEIVNCATGRVHGFGTDTLTGSVTGVGSGTLTWFFFFSATVAEDCETLTSFEGRGVVVSGTGELAGLHGRLDFAFDLTYTGVLR
jgi:hypothetical protein